MQPATTKKCNNLTVGKQGELIAATYLKKQGFTVVTRNYRKKWGEIDIIVLKYQRIHFVEVKTVSYETKADLTYAVTQGTWRPEENVHPFKLKKLARAIECWLIESKWNGEWQIDVVAVRVVLRETYATVKYLDNIVL